MDKIIENRFFVENEFPARGISLFNTFRVRDMIENKQVVVKIMKDEFASNEDIVKAFQLYYQNFRINVKDTSHLVKVTHIFGPQSKKVYLVREYYEGMTLDEYLNKNPNLKAEEIFPIFEQICKGLHSLHLKELYHYMVEPGNILITNEGQVKILSFGSLFAILGNKEIIAKLELKDNKYIAPEIIEGNSRDTINASCDIYSAGKILEILPLIVDNTIIKEATEKDSSLRYSKLQDFLNAVEPGKTIISEIDEIFKMVIKEELQKESMPEEPKQDKTIKEKEVEKKEQVKEFSIIEPDRILTVQPNKDFNFIPEISVDDTSSLIIKCTKKPNGVRFDKSNGEISWRPSEKNSGLHDVELIIICGKEEKEIKFQIKVLEPEVIPEPSIEIKPNFPKDIKPGQVTKCYVQCLNPEYYGFKFEKVPKFAECQFDKEEESGSVTLNAGEKDAGVYDIIITLFLKEDKNKDVHSYKYKINVINITEPKKSDKKDKPPETQKGSFKQSFKNFLPTIIILCLVAILSFAIIYFRPPEYLPSPLTVTPEIIEQEKESFEAWLRDDILQRIQDARAMGGLGQNAINKILREVIQENRDKINYTILERQIDLSALRIKQLLDELK